MSCSLVVIAGLLLLSRLDEIMLMPISDELGKFEKQTLFLFMSIVTTGSQIPQWESPLSLNENMIPILDL